MNPLYDYKRFAVLYVDDEEKSLKYFKANFEDKFRVLIAPNAREGWEIFHANEDDIAILITDQRMPGESGVQLLEKVRQRRPKTIRLLATAYSDLEAAVAAVNNGAIYKYISKPWDVRELEITLMRAMEFFIIQGERDHLLREKLSAMHRVMMTDRLISLGLLASGLSHHMRNSLVAVKVFLDLAPRKLEDEVTNLEKLRDPNYWQDFYKTVQVQLQKITGLLDNLGGLSQPPQPQFDTQVKISALVNQAVTQQTSELRWQKRKIQVEVSGTEPLIKVDEKMMQQFFQRLLQSLALAVPEGATLKIHLQPGADQSVQLDLVAEGLRLPENSLRHLFDPFYVAGHEADDAGLDLLTCYFIIYHHGGHFSASVNDKGEAHYSIKFLKEPGLTPAVQDEQAFLNKVFAVEAKWEQLLMG
jgi:two-component system probable response regulator PhcQ